MIKKVKEEENIQILSLGKIDSIVKAMKSVENRN